tara:strand:- start:9 stop:212 length:204 start_codon:yes stop_codon:yes gene_type:complete
MIKLRPEGTNNEKNEKPNEILSIHNSEFMIIRLVSFIFKDRNNNRKKYINDNNKIDFIKIIKLTNIL